VGNFFEKDLIDVFWVDHVQTVDVNEVEILLIFLIKFFGKFTLFEFWSSLICFSTSNTEIVFPIPGTPEIYRQ
jgi:hypothetical protein